MKVFVCLFAAIACVSGSVLHHPAIAVATGSSSQSRTQDAAGNYAFAYNEQHATGGSSRSESGSPGVKIGSYTLNVADGRQRVVNYQADALGFRAAIATNEPGTAAQPAADTSISSPHAAPVPVAPAPVAVAAPVYGHLAAPAIAAPVAVAHAPIAVAHAIPAVSSYSTHINHAQAAPLLHHARLAVPLLHAAPAHLAPALHY